GNSMTVKSVQFKNNNYVYGKSVQIESNNVHNKATIDSVDANIIAYYGMKNEGQIIAAKDLTLDTKNFADITNYGTLQAGENLTIIANKVYNGGYRCGFLKLS
ncbi:TPA: filamentous hemagglutinin, partial [Klebsiella quasipneumoniae]|nr:filamentous hemagglutinin [Klebsiella quasipneumoniae]